ncbi:MAG: hypothetical protein L3J46_00285 [Kangiellaceae bacterium]|nr:hypothetical protein [Kangiellaceae bacterium]
MEPETYKYLLLGLFSFVVIGSLFLTFKNGFKLEKRSKRKPLFRVQSKDEKQQDFVGNLLIIGLFILFLFIFSR